MTQILAAVIAGIFQVIVAMIRRSSNGAEKEEGRFRTKRPSSRRK